MTKQFLRRNYPPLFVCVLITQIGKSHQTNRIPSWKTTHLTSSYQFEYQDREEIHTAQQTYRRVSSLDINTSERPAHPPRHFRPPSSDEWLRRRHWLGDAITNQAIILYSINHNYVPHLPPPKRLRTSSSGWGVANPLPSSNMISNKKQRQNLDINIQKGNSRS